MRMASPFTVTEYRVTNMAEKKNEAASPESTAAPAGKKRFTKVDAVAEALAACGQDAPRPDVQDWIKNKFGFTMSVDHISNCKKVLAKKAGISLQARRRKKRKPGPKKGRAARTQAAEKPVAPPQAKPAPAAAARTVALEDILKLKELLTSIGGEHLKTLIDVMSH
jgi:hypothetical protein